MYKNQPELIDALVSANILSKDQADQVLKEASSQGKEPEAILLSGKIIEEAVLVGVKASLLNLPIAELENETIARKVLDFLPKEVAENYRMVVFKKDKKSVYVGMVNPQDFKAIEVVEFLAQKQDLSPRYHIITEKSFNYALRQYQALGDEVQEVLANIGEDDQILGEMPATAKEMEQVIKSAPVSKMMLVIIRHAIEGRASDIHIEPTSKDTKIRYRIDGMLRTSLVLPKYIHAAVVARIKVLANLKLDEARKPQDGRIRLTIEGRDIDFRVSTLPLVEGEKVVLRILDTEKKAPSLTELGLNPVHIELLEQAMTKPYGMILLTGPTGSGKTTTLYTVLSIINKDNLNIVTLEDPIEYYIDGVNQSQIHPEIGFSFASGLRSILRQDPNVVMVGEIRDQETAELVIHASLTGHLMLSTLHTSNAVGAIPRLIDMGAEFYLLSAVVNLIMSQRLARKICPHCKEQVEVPSVILDRIKKKVETIPAKYLTNVDKSKLVFYKGKGCSRCADLGYQGRTAVAEVIYITPEIREIINKGGNIKDIEKALIKQDFIDLTQDCLLRALNGETTVDEVMRISHLS
jgi:type IV pilus assembly protein PilB